MANISGVLEAIDDYTREIERSNEITVLYSLKTGLENNIYVSDGKKQKLLYLLSQKIEGFNPIYNGIKYIHNVCYCIL